MRRPYTSTSASISMFPFTHPRGVQLVATLSVGLLVQCSLSSRTPRGCVNGNGYVVYPSEAYIRSHPTTIMYITTTFSDEIYKIPHRANYQFAVRTSREIMFTSTSHRSFAVRPGSCSLRRRRYQCRVIPLMISNGIVHFNLAPQLRTHRHITT